MDQYEEHLQVNLQDLLARLHRGTYRPHPSLRCDIPKGNGKTRPLGIGIPSNLSPPSGLAMTFLRTGSGR